MIAPALAVAAVVTATPGDFHGQPALILRNAITEAVVAPAWGRIVRFAPLDGAGAFWTNPAVAAGGKLAPDAEGWINVGGDRALPAPQSDWPAIVGRPWPPPAAFDARPYTGAIVKGKLEIVSEVDPGYGIRIRREIALDPLAPVMTVETTFEKVSGRPVRVAVWTITQLASPDRVAVLLPERSVLSIGYLSMLPDPPKDLVVAGRVVSLARDPSKKTMIGTDGSALVWVGAGPDLVIEYRGSKPAGGGMIADKWPGGGMHAQIYTNAAADAPYVELELLDHLRDLAPGDHATMRVEYTLVKRQESDPVREAKRVLLPPR